MRAAWSRALRENGLTLLFIGLFLVTMFGLSAAGYFQFNADQIDHHEQTYSYGRYLLSSNFVEQMSENWESEFLQFASFIAASIWLRQKGSTESKELDKSAMESDKEQLTGDHATDESPRWAAHKDWRGLLYSWSLLIVMTFLFLASWAAQAVSGWSEYNSTQQQHGQPTVSWLTYTQGADFWSATLQNWQSEFLAVASICIFTVFLRQRGSPQSKPVGAPHEQTGVSG